MKVRDLLIISVRIVLFYWLISLLSAVLQTFSVMVPFYDSEEYSYAAGLILAFLIGALIISGLIAKAPALISLLSLDTKIEADQVELKLTANEVVPIIIVVFGFSMIIFGITDFITSIVFYLNDRLINSASNFTRFTGPVLRIVVGFLLFNNSQLVRSWIMKAIKQDSSNQ